MMELGTMLILAGCLAYSIFNAMFFVFVYYRRRMLEREEGISFTESAPPDLMFQSTPSLRYQVVPIEKVSNFPTLRRGRKGPPPPRLTD